MPWIVTEGHTCDKPEDWSKMAIGAVWRCPTCRQQWIVRGWRSKLDDRQHSLRFERTTAIERWLMGELRLI